MELMEASRFAHGNDLRERRDRTKGSNRAMLVKCYVNTLKY